jgi:hypothetical protein
MQVCHDVCGWVFVSPSVCQNCSGYGLCKAASFFLASIYADNSHLACVATSGRQALQGADRVQPGWEASCFVGLTNSGARYSSPFSRPGIRVCADIAGSVAAVLVLQVTAGTCVCYLGQDRSKHALRADNVLT